MGILKPYPIDLLPQLGAWAMFSLRKEDPGFKQFSQKVLKRDQYKCRYCGFQSEYHQEVINADRNFRNNKLGNLVTACCFCAQCFFLDVVGKCYGGGSLIYLPEISQNRLNALCHILFSFLSGPSEQGSFHRSNVQAIYNDLKKRSKPVEDKFGKGLSKPMVFLQIIIDTPLKERSEKAARMALHDLRLLPSRKRFNKQIQDWAKSGLANAVMDDI